MTPTAKSTQNQKTRLTSIRTNRSQGQLVVSGVQDGGIVTIPAADLKTLNVDESYQRGEITSHVNHLIGVLQAGGTIPDPITVAVRPNGSRWIVDGQQRFWAHYNCDKPIQAHLLHVPNLEAERTLFSIYNNSVRPAPGVRIKAWPGSAGRLMYWLDSAGDSPVRGEVGWVGAGCKFPAIHMARGVYSALTGAVKPPSKAEKIMQALDKEIERDSHRAEHAARFFALLWKQLLPETSSDAAHRLPRGHVIALASACAVRWKNATPKGEWPTPSPVEMGKLRRMNWHTYDPDGVEAFVSVLRDQILRRWA